MPFKQSHHGDFTRAAGSMNLASTSAAVHVAGQTADESFIDFNRPTQVLCKRFGLHRQSDTVLLKSCICLLNLHFLTLVFKTRLHTGLQSLSQPMNPEA